MADPEFTLLGDAVWLDIQLEAGMDDGGGDRIMAAAGAQRRDRAFIVAVDEPELVGRQIGVMELGFGDVSHRDSGARIED